LKDHLAPDAQVIPLDAGRHLAYAEFGDPLGKPVLYCHGHPGSRLDPLLFDQDLLRRSGVRIIAPDRPGIGRSDFLPARRIIDWPGDVCELMDLLGIPEFAVLALSAGGPFAAAAAHALPERVSRLVLVSSLGRFDIPGGTSGMGPGLLYFRLGQRLPWLVKLQLRLMAAGARSNPAQVAAQMKKNLPPAALVALELPGMLDVFIATLQEFLRSGPEGPAWEAGLFMRPWGFDLGGIQAECFLWHGEQDRNAPVAMGRDLAIPLPGCRANFVPGEGHFSIVRSCAADFFTALTHE
jgi:pimeloyl-ACP methyl ester carboxylesterase